MKTRSFSPVILRAGTAYGTSPRLRLDLVINDFVASACVEGTIVIRSDGRAWRPLVHVEDMARAFVGAMETPRDVVHGRVFNIGRTEDCFRVRELAHAVADVVPGCRIEPRGADGRDPRSYRVRCDRFAAALPEFAPQWSLHRGVRDLRETLTRLRLGVSDARGARFIRLRRVLELQREGRMDGDLLLCSPDRAPTMAGTD